jgi:hypothetical protein
MAESSRSAKMIFRLSLSLLGAAAVLIFAMPAWHSARTWYSAYRYRHEPVVVRPEISGTIRVNGQPRSGVRLHEHAGDIDSPPTCEALPTLARSDSSGVFRAVARTGPRHSAPTEFHANYFCLELDGTVLYDVIHVVDPSTVQPIQLDCDYPGSQTGHFEDRPCRVVRPNNSSKPTPLRGAA